MFDVVKLLFDICVFKKGPQDLPYSFNFLRLLVIINMISSFLILSMRMDWLNSLLEAIVGIFLVGAFSWIALSACRKLSRFYQTTCALLGVDTLLGFFAIPAMATMMTGQGGWPAFLIMLGLIGWHWAIIGYIMYRAMEQSLSFSLGLAFLYLLGSYKLMALLFPEAS
jgi:hypothetical protein